jgi:hypothetical protein
MKYLNNQKDNGRNIDICPSRGGVIVDAPRQLVTKMVTCKPERLGGAALPKDYLFKFFRGPMNFS